MGDGGVDAGSDQRTKAPRRREDARRSRERLLAAADTELGRDPRASLEQVASAAGVGRSTLYRHFANRDELSAALDERREVARRRVAEPRRDSRLVTAGDHPGLVLAAPTGAQDLEGASLAEVRPPGQLGGEEPLVVDATHVLNEIPPHLVGEQLVGEARRIAGVPVALYVIDVDGSYLRRLAGSDEFPPALEGPLSVGPEIAPDALPELYARLETVLPDCRPYPMWLRGRAVGVLLALRRPRSSLAEIARQGTAALELAGQYTDTYEVARRRRVTTPAAEVQLNLLPPRNAQLGGGEIAGSLLPSYDVAGDWFDYVENADGTWLAIAETHGRGSVSSALSSVALGALRAARRSGGGLEEATAAMDRAVAETGVRGFAMSAVVARWHAPTSMLTWVSCGEITPLLLTASGGYEKLLGRVGARLGRSRKAGAFEVRERRLRPNDRVILVTGGVTERRNADGARLGLEGVARAALMSEDRSAAATARHVQEGVTGASEEPLEDDAAVIVLTVH